MHASAQDGAPDGARARRGRLAVPAALGLLLTVGIAVVGNAVLDVSQGHDLVSGLAVLVRQDPQVFALSTLLVWCVLAALVALTGRVVVPGVVVLAVALGLAAANHQKIAMRNEPVYPSDVGFLGQAGFLADMVGTRFLVTVVLVGVLGAGLTVAVCLLLRRRLAVHRWRRGGPAHRAWWAARVALLTVAVLGLSTVRGFHEEDSSLRAAFESSGVEWATWSQLHNYQHNGFVAGVLYNSQVEAMQRPPGYSQARMQQVVERWTRVAQRRTAANLAQRRPAATWTGPEPHVVVVLSETFSDPTRMPGVEPAEDPIPFTRRLMERTPSGRKPATMLGGTANAEFEALTGLSVSQFEPQLTTPYQMLVPGHPDFPSALTWFESRGYRSVGMHPHDDALYRRDEVYAALGFDRTEFRDEFPDGVRIDHDHYLSDASAFDRVLEDLAASDGPAFYQAVTIQNHMPYAGKYDDPIPVAGVEDGLAEEVAQYARGLRHSDDAMRDFLAGLRELERPTLVVFYGDHGPSLWTSSEARARLERDSRVFETPWFLWSSRRPLRGDVPRVASPIYYLPLLLDRAGLPVPPYYELLLRLSERLPGLLPGRYLTPEGRVPVDGLPPATAALLEDYRLVQYDLTVGAGWSRDGLFADPGPGRPGQLSAVDVLQARGTDSQVLRDK